MNQDSTSLNKWISSKGICSRREADGLIEQGRVILNGKVAQKGNRVSPGDRVEVDGSVVKNKPRKDHLYIALNKPVGIVCTTEMHNENNIISFINHPKRLFPIGRLDKSSEGLIFLTNDGDIVNKILRAHNNHQKEYLVQVNKKITSEFVKKMANGIPILGIVTKQCKVQKINARSFKITLIQGLNRQIRRMCNHLGYKVTDLKRTRIMNVELGNLPTGKWRKLNLIEIEEINQLTKDSSKNRPKKKSKTKNFN